MSNEMICVLLLDASGSMSSDRDNVLKGVNDYITNLQDDYTKHPEYGKVFFNLITFQSSLESDSIEFIYNMTPIEEVEQIPSHLYTTSGGTPLFKSVIKVIDSLEVMRAEEPNVMEDFIKLRQGQDVKNSKIVFVIQTDGYDTTGNNPYSATDVQNRIKKCEERGNWSVVFLGAGLDAMSQGEVMGLSQGSTYAIRTKNSGGVVHVDYGSTYTGVAAATSNLRTSSNLSTNTMGRDIKSYVESIDDSDWKSKK